MSCPTDTARETLERDITEALLRLKLARAERDRGAAAERSERLDWLLDRWAAHMRVDGEMAE